MKIGATRSYLVLSHDVFTRGLLGEVFIIYDRIKQSVDIIEAKINDCVQLGVQL